MTYISALRAVFCVMGRCDPKDDHGEVADKIDDYLWMKLSQISHDDDDTPAQEKLTLSQLQRLLLEEFGEYAVKQVIHRYSSIHWQVSAVDKMATRERLQCMSLCGFDSDDAEKHF